MSKVTRQKFDEKESYGLKDDWLILFAHELEKQSYLSNLKPVIHRTVHSTIDEKMSDIKNRIGFDLITKLNVELEELSKVSQAGTSCGCAPKADSCACPVKTANYEHPKDEIKKMQGILNYIKDMIESEPHLNTSIVIARCKDTEGLGYNMLRIDEGKLKSYIADLFEKYGDDDDEEVKYIKKDLDDSASNMGIEQADYYSHARPDS